MTFEEYKNQRERKVKGEDITRPRRQVEKPKFIKIDGRPFQLIKEGKRTKVVSIGGIRKTYYLDSEVIG